MAWATELLGATLLTKEGPLPTAEVLASKKFVALYFSAHVSCALKQPRYSNGARSSSPRNFVRARAPSRTRQYAQPYRACTQGAALRVRK